MQPGSLESVCNPLTVRRDLSVKTLKSLLRYGAGVPRRIDCIVSKSKSLGPAWRKNETMFPFALVATSYPRTRRLGLTRQLLRLAIRPHGHGRAEVFPNGS